MARNKKQKYIMAPTAEDMVRIKAGEKFSDITAGPIKKALDNDLKESIDSVDESSEVVESSTKSNIKIRRGLYFVVGVFVSLMSIIGIIFSVTFIAGKIKDIADNTALKNEMQKDIYPLVVIDTPTYEKSEDLSMDVVIAAAAWDIIINGDKSKYETSFGVMTVPASDIEVHANKIFGHKFDFEHKTVTSVETTFEYMPENNSYVIPISPHFLPYAPQVSDVVKVSDNKYQLKVEYYPPVKIWFPDEKVNAEPDKIMKYTLVKTGNKQYKIVSIDYYDKKNQNIS